MQRYTIIVIVLASCAMACGASEGSSDIGDSRAATGLQTAVPGPQGEKGAEGEQGPQGPKGEQGPAVPLAKTKTYTRTSSPVVVAADSNAAASASCTLATDVLVTGGCIVTGARVLLQSSYPENASDTSLPAAWTCRAMNLQAGEGAIVAYAVCATP